MTTGVHQRCCGQAPIAGGTSPPSGPAGGDLAGSYPDPTVVNFHIGGVDNTRGDLARRGAAAWEAFPALTNGNVVAGNGTDAVSVPIATPLAVAPSNNLAALGLQTTYSLASASGWTTVDGSGTASIVTASQVARLTLGTGVVPGAWANVPKVVRAHGMDPFNFDVRARVAAWTGGNSANVFLSFGIRLGTASNQGAFPNNRGDGETTFFCETVFGTGIKSTTALGRGVVAGGQYWMRLSIRVSLATLWYGVGVAAAEPTNWIAIGSVQNVTSLESQYLVSIVMALDAIGGGSPDDVTVDLDSIKVQGSPTP